MNIRFAGKHFEVSEAIRRYLKEKLDKLEKYSSKVVESHVVLKKERYLFDAQITLRAKNFKAYGEGKRKENIYAAIDQACDRVETQLKKFREKVKDRHKGRNVKGGIPVSPKVVRALASEAALGGRKPAIVRSRDFAPKPMSAAEASLQLEISKRPFLVFLNAATRSVNVIFKQEDGNHGLIEPEY